MELYFDRFGNIYNKKDGEYYCLLIDNHEDIYWMLLDVNIMKKHDKNIKYSVIKHTKNKNGLHRKVINELIMDDEMEEPEDFYPEANYFQYDYNGVNEEFSIAQDKGYEIIKPFDYMFDSSSLYDTLIIDDKNGDKSNIIFAMETMSCLCYRVIIYTTGTIELDIIGSKRKIFNI